MMWHREFLLLSHRGFVEDTVENTLGAFAQVRSSGADGFETDVRVTADGLPVCYRDAALSRLCPLNGLLKHVTYGALKAAFPALAGLADALEFAADQAILLDIKVETGAEVDCLATVLEASPHTHNVMLGTRSMELAELLAVRLPNRPLLGFGLPEPLLPAFYSLGGRWQRLGEPEVTPDAMMRTRDQGLRVLLGIGEGYPGNEGPVTPAKLQHALAMEPDAVLLDDPRLWPQARGPS